MRNQNNPTPKPLTFTVRNMQTEMTMGWAARAMTEHGLRVSSRSGLFGSEIFLVKDGNGNHIALSQNIETSRKLDGSKFNSNELAIARILVNCGLLVEDGKITSVASSSPPQKLEDYPALECPLCSALRKPTSLNLDGSVSYGCPADHVNHGSRYHWKIAVDGTLVE